MYVSHASRILSERDLDLIRFLYDHYLLSGKRVVWVVTAIDAAANLDLRNLPEWKATIARNNAYLRHNFTLPTGQPDPGFIGEGFLPVSPALEARADKLSAEGAETAAQRQRAESRMETLRQAIEDLISTGTGARHIAAVATEARILVTPRYQALAVWLRDERLEIDELKEHRSPLHPPVRPSPRPAGPCHQGHRPQQAHQGEPDSGVQGPGAPYMDRRACRSGDPVDRGVRGLQEGPGPGGGPGLRRQGSRGTASGLHS